MDNNGGRGNAAGEKTAAGAGDNHESKNNNNNNTNNNSNNRRRTGSLKRKISGATGPSKRLAKDRDRDRTSAPSSFVNGSSSSSSASAKNTRQTPLKSAAKLTLPHHQKPANFAFPQSSLIKPAVPPVEQIPGSKDSDGLDQQASVLNWELSEEVIKNKDAHIVPNSAGWFAWGKIHALEERALPSFFDKKCSTRSPEMYLEVRNAIMKRYHNCPSKHINFSDLSDLASDDKDAVREIMEFLDHWGLINFCPFSEYQADDNNANDKTNNTIKEVLDIGDATEVSLLLENLYSFQKLDSRSSPKPSGTMLSRQLPASVLAESLISDALMRPQGPAVEYHCNFCSADCSTKRYHCQKQADFDLCPGCYNAGRFGQGMVSTDFLLMEPVRSGSNSGSWTDQETLLLLEALELYGNNWNEIAEHVATKSKAQCILHFIRLPIEDPFFEDGDPLDTTLQSSTVTLPENRDSAISAPQNSSGSPLAKSSSSEDLVGVSNSGVEKMSTEDEKECPPQQVENDAIKALSSAFQAFGNLSGSEKSMSIAEAGNPAMAVVAFLAGIVGPQIASCSAKSTLKALSQQNPSFHLAARHCFQLEDPPNDSKDHTSAQTGAEKLEERAALLGTPQPSEGGSPEKTENLISAEKPKVTDPLEEAPSTKMLNSPVLEPQGGGTDGNAGTADPEKPKTVTEEKCDESTADVEGSHLSEQLANPVVKNCSEDPSTTDGSDSLDQKKTAINDKIPEDSPKAKDGGSNKKLEDEKKQSGAAEVDESESLDRLKRAAVSILSAASVKAKLLANQEETTINHLTATVIDNQLRKLEIKLRNFKELENALLRQREPIERTRQRLHYERSQIFVSRFGSQNSLARSGSPFPATNASAMTSGPSRFGQTLRPGSAKPPVFPSSLNFSRRNVSTDNNNNPTTSLGALSGLNQAMPHSDGGSTMGPNVSFMQK